MVGESSQSDSQLGGFSNVDAGGGEDLVARLDAMQTVASFQQYKPDTFEMLRLTPGARVAEIGCGTGEDARELARLVGPQGRAVGFDISDTMLDQARARHLQVANLEFRRGDASALDAPDGGFDAARADRVLLHMPDPRRAIGEMLRITRSGGRVVVCEPDISACWFATNDDSLAETVIRAIAQSCAHPYLARHLWTTCRDAGLGEQSLAIRNVTSFSPEAFDQILHISAVAARLAASGQVPQEHVQSWLADIVERGRTGRFVAGVSIMIVSGTKP